MSESAGWSFSLNRDDIRRRKAERDQIAEQIAALQQRLEAEDRWLEAVSLILPPAFTASITGLSPSEGGEGRSVWRRAAELVLLGATRGLYSKEIAQAIREGEDESMRERIFRNQNGLYSALERMVADGQIIRSGDKFYSPILFASLDGAEEPDSQDIRNELKGVNAFIVDFIAKNGPCVPKILMEALRNTERYAERIKRNPQYGYSALARLIRQGHLTKDGSIYALPSKENEPSDVGTSNGSEAASVFD